MTLDATKVAAQANDLITREQEAYSRLVDLIKTNQIVVAYAEVLALHADAAGREAAATAASLTLTGLLTEPTLPTASLTAASDGASFPSLLSVIAAVVTQVVTAREAQDSTLQTYQNNLAQA